MTEHSTVEDFFGFIKKRHNIYLAKERGDPWPWTEDEILRDWKFCNVFRELDRTTIWFRENFREEYRDQGAVIFGTIAFRWLNFIPSGQALLDKGLLANWDSDKALEVLSSIPQVVGPAYMIRTDTGISKVEGVIKNIDYAWRFFEGIEQLLRTENLLLEEAHTWLQALPNMGGFIAYEVVTDLRHTSWLEDAPDIMTWASPGPGAVRGVNRLLGVKTESSVGPEVYQANMQELLRLSKDFLEDFPPLEMRDIEHSLCEFDKYERARLKEGPMKVRYFPPGARRLTKTARRAIPPGTPLLVSPKKRK